MKTALAATLLVALAGAAQAQSDAPPIEWSASTGASAPATVAEVRITRPVNAAELERAVAPAAAACEIKPVMADADYARCGGRPPNYHVDFGLPWPPEKEISGHRRVPTGS